MKKILKLFCLVLSVVTLATGITSCGVIKGDTVMEYDGYKITEAMYSYWKSHFKTAFINAYGTVDVDGRKNVNWDEKLPDGTTYEMFFEETIVNSYARRVLVSMKLFDLYDLEFDDEITEAIDDLIDGIISIYGDKKTVNAYLGNYGLNLKTLEMIYYEEAKVQIVSDYIFSSGGPCEVLNSERIKYYEDNYYCVNWIYIYTEKKPADPEEGTNSDGSYIMVDMSESEKAQKRALVESIISKLTNGEKTFSELKKEYCEDKYSDGTSKYDYLPNGFNLCADDYASYGVDLIKLIQGMQIGDIETYDDEYGGTRIIVRNALTDFTSLTPSEKSFMLDFETYVTETKWDEIISAANIVADTAVMERYAVKKVIPFDNFVI